MVFLFQTGMKTYDKAPVLRKRRSVLLRDLKLIQLKDYETLSEQIVEIKRMLTVLVQKLTAEG